MLAKLKASIRATILPFVVGRRGSWGPRCVQTLKCTPLDLFFTYCPVLGNGIQYELCVPLVAWFAGDEVTLVLLGSLFAAFFLANATKDVLELPRPEGCIKIEQAHLEQYGFPSTHTAGACCWGYALHSILELSGYAGAVSNGALSVAYVALVCTSRLYVGVHSIADNCGGFVCGIGGESGHDSLLPPTTPTLPCPRRRPSDPAHEAAATMVGGMARSRPRPGPAHDADPLCHPTTQEFGWRRGC